MLDSYKSCRRPALANIPSWREDAISCRTEMSMSYTLAFDNFSTELNQTNEPTSNEKYFNNAIGDLFIERLAQALNIYYTPVLIVLGCIGNLLSIIVFYKSKLRIQSTSQYLSALAVSDTLFVLQLLPPWLKAAGTATLFTQDGYCQLFAYLSYVTSNLSSWLVVAFTVERFVAVVYPLRRNAVCTVRRARHVIASLAAVSLLLNLPMLWFAVPTLDDCNIDDLLMVHAARFNLLDTVVTFTVPMAVIVVLNAWIMAGVYRLGRGTLMRQQEPQQGRAPRPMSLQRSQQKVTRMLLIVSTVYVLLNLPAYSLRIAAYANNMGGRPNTGRAAAVQQICLLFFNTNFGINFALYCLSGQNFRNALVETFTRLCRQRCRPNIELMEMRGLASAPPPRPSSVSRLCEQSFSNSATAATSCGASASGRRSVGARSNSAAQCEVIEQDILRSRRLWRRRQPRVIKRWRFDNSRHQRDVIEMRQYVSTDGSIELQQRVRTRECLELQQCMSAGESLKVQQYVRPGHGATMPGTSRAGASGSRAYLHAGAASAAWQRSPPRS